MDPLGLYTQIFVEATRDVLYLSCNCKGRLGKSSRIRLPLAEFSSDSVISLRERIDPGSPLKNSHDYGPSSRVGGPHRMTGGLAFIDDI